MYPFKCDMSDTNNVQEMFEWIENHSELGRVDVCICNAALVAAKKLSEIRWLNYQILFDYQNYKFKYSSK